MCYASGFRKREEVIGDEFGVWVGHSGTQRNAFGFQYLLWVAGVAQVSPDVDIERSPTQVAACAEQTVCGWIR
ncbi:hypothetical protein CRM90_10885 [Mycobacterium sp. ENV421]|nr:hypothetical protein CRM90_10885 [Mycobacterium sp. ENV421]